MTLGDFARYGIGVSASSIKAQTGTVVFSNSNNLSFGMSAAGGSGFTLTASRSVSGLLTAISSLSAGTTQITSGQVVISNGGGFSFGVNGQTLTAAVANVSLLDNRIAFGTVTVVGASTAPNLSVQRLPVWQPISATRVDFPVSVSAAGSQNGSVTISFAAYTFNGVTASLASSATAAITWTSGSNSTATSVYGANSGYRWQSVSLATWAITPGDYLFGAMLSVNGPAGTTAVLRVLGSADRNVGSVVSASGGNITAYLFHGLYSTGTGAFPTSIRPQDVNNTDTVHTMGLPFFQLAGTY